MYTVLVYCVGTKEHQLLDCRFCNFICTKTWCSASTTFAAGGWRKGWQGSSSPLWLQQEMRYHCADGGKIVDSYLLWLKISREEEGRGGDSGGKVPGKGGWGGGWGGGWRTGMGGGGGRGRGGLHFVSVKSFPNGKNSSGRNNQLWFFFLFFGGPHPQVAT